MTRVHVTAVAKSDDGWHATCACGWAGNNPYDDEQAASDGAVYHASTGPVDDARSSAAAAFAAAANPDERALALDAYNHVGK